ncbi:hypothetical protein vseg_016781 [Gypsophila vaccaria]
MGKRGKTKQNNTQLSSNGYIPMSIREEASGRKQSQNPKSLLKLNHLKNLAVWSSGFPQFGGLGAFFGHSFAAFGESLGVSNDPSLFPCQSCETILQPGVNCTIRIEKNKVKRHKRSKLKTPTQNNVVYTCHFCSHRNLKRGTPKGYVKEIAPSRAVSSKNESVTSAVQKDNTIERSSTVDASMNTRNATPSLAVSNTVDSLTESPASSLATLLDSKKRKRKKPGPKGSDDKALVNSAPPQVEKVGGTSKKRRKAWTTVKEIAENEERERSKRFSNFSIPFAL